MKELETIARPAWPPVPWAPSPGGGEASSGGRSTSWRRCATAHGQRDRLLHRKPRPDGVHTGDFITVAPAQTLTDKEYQRLRDASLRIIREIGVETGGSNIQDAVKPAGLVAIAVVEMNPRVSRSSALASKATGFPIAKIAAKLAVG